MRQLAAIDAAETPSPSKLAEKRKGHFDATYSSMKAKEIDLISKDEYRVLEFQSQRLELDRKLAAEHARES